MSVLPILHIVQPRWAHVLIPCRCSVLWLPVVHGTNDPTLHPSREVQLLLQLHKDLPIPKPSAIPSISSRFHTFSLRLKSYCFMKCSDTGYCNQEQSRINSQFVSLQRGPLGEKHYCEVLGLPYYTINISHVQKDNNPLTIPLGIFGTHHPRIRPKQIVVVSSALFGEEFENCWEG